MSQVIQIQTKMQRAGSQHATSENLSVETVQTPPDSPTQSSPDSTPNEDMVNRQGLPSSIHNVFKQSYLLKRGKWNKNFQKRWVVLKDGRLCYFPNNTTKKPTDSIDLQDTFVRKAPELNTEHDARCFMLFTKERNYYFVADDVVQMNEWIVALRMAGSILDPNRKETSEVGVFSEEAAKELLFERLKFQSKNATAQNDAYLEEVLSNHELEKKQKLVELEHMLRDDFRTQLEEKENEHEARIRKQGEHFFEQERLLRMQALDREVALQKEVNRIKLEGEKNTKRLEDDYEKKLRDLEKIYLEIINNQTRQITKLEQDRTPPPPTSQWTDDFVTSLQEQIMQLVAQVQREKMQAENRTIEIKRQIQSHCDLKLVEQRKEFQMKIISMQKDHRCQLAENGASLTSELGRAIYNKDKDLIRLKYGHGLNDSDAQDDEPIQKQVVDRSISEFYSGAALKEAVSHIERLVKQVEELEKHVVTLEMALQEKDIDLDYKSTVMEAQQEQVRSLQTFAVMDKNEIEQQVLSRFQSELRDLRTRMGDHEMEHDRLRMQLRDSTIEQERLRAELVSAQERHKKELKELQDHIEQLKTYNQIAEEEKTRMKQIEREISLRSRSRTELWTEPFNK